VRNVTVLVTAAGSAPAQALIAGLRNQDALGVRLIGVDTTSRSAGLFDCDRRYTVPRVDDPRFLEAIDAICAAEEVEILTPIADFELQLFAEQAPRLRDELGVHVITNRPEAVALARDKEKSAHAVAAAGVAIPAFHDPHAPEPARLPVIVKPRSGAGSQGVTIVREAEALDGALELAGPGAVVQDFIAGPEYTVDLVIAPDGEVLAAAPRIRVEVRAGQSYKGTTVDAPDVAQNARRCAQALGLTAQANVQLIRADADGHCYFIEANPKFAAAMGLTIGAGMNIPLLYVKLALALPVAASELERQAGAWLLRSWRDRVVGPEEIDAVPEWTATADVLAPAREP
jgi:carbamoyl-phosphate synthase large subunit